MVLKKKKFNDNNKTVEIYAKIVKSKEENK